VRTAIALLLVVLCGCSVEPDTRALEVSIARMLEVFKNYNQARFEEERVSLAAEIHVTAPKLPHAQAALYEIQIAMHNLLCVTEEESMKHGSYYPLTPEWQRAADRTYAALEKGQEALRR
jgi:hypothetical protein